MAGPRDWLPTDVDTPMEGGPRRGPRRDRRDRHVNPRSTGGHRWSSWICLALGFGAAAIASIPPRNGLTTNGFIYSGVGIIAIAFGIDAIRHRRTSRSGSTAIAIVGIILGGVGTLIMVVQLIVFFLNAGTNGGTLGLLGSRPIFQLPSAPGVQQPSAQPPTAPPTAPLTKAITPGDETSTLAQVERSLTHTLTMTTPAGSSWPEALIVASDGQSIVLQSGQVVGRMPPDTQLHYSRSADGANFSLVLTGRSGVVVQYDTQSRAITTR